MEFRQKLTSQRMVEVRDSVVKLWERGKSHPTHEINTSPTNPVQLWEYISYALLISVAFSMRLWDLGSRAFHHDESLHAYFSWELYSGRGLQHNPMLHGPFQFEANAALFFLLGDNDYTARLLYVIMGVALVVMPVLFRNRLGNMGAIITSLLLTVSPSMLYFSRFARNDIIMAVWTLGLVTCLWRYIDEGKNRYLYVAAALTALSFATKETSYLVTGLLGLFLVLVNIQRNWSAVIGKIHVQGMSPPKAFEHLARNIWSNVRQSVELRSISRETSFLLLLITLTLPQWSALFSVFQYTPLLDWANITLANPGTTSPIGAPSGIGTILATILVLGLLVSSAYLGYLWNWSIWWRSSIIFYLIWLSLYTTLFSHMAGAGSGVWQGLAYWIVQQGEARGEQPLYYYAILTSIYEYLPLLIGTIACIYYIKRNSLFSYFLVYWCLGTFILYTIASEKMPWLLVNITLPLIVITGKFLGEIMREIRIKCSIKRDSAIIIPGIAVLLLLVWKLTFFEFDTYSMIDLLILILLVLSILAIIGLAYYYIIRFGSANLLYLSIISITVILLLLSIRTSITASFKNGDVPVEMIIYTQTSPDVPNLVQSIENIAEDMKLGKQLSLHIDQTSGFTWPWAWYLRDYPNVVYPSYEDTPLEKEPEVPLILIHYKFYDDVKHLLSDKYEEGIRIKHRWWFPEEAYRNLTLGKFLGSFLVRDSWRTAMNYFLNRQGMRNRIGSEDAYLFCAKELPCDYFVTLENSK